MNRFSDIDVTLKRLPAVYGYQNQQLVSIEKALEPIESQINDLKGYIKTAKKYCHYPSEHGLTRDESATVYIYTMEWDETSLYRLLNKALRDENRQNIKIWFPYLKLFDTALDKLPTMIESVWRGIPLDIGKNFTKNQLLTWWTVSSCSSSVNVIKSFIGHNKSSTLFLIETMNGKKVSGYTAYEGEDEIVLKIGTQFRVKSDPLEQSNQSHIVHLIEIDDNDDDDELVTSPMKNLSVTSNPRASQQIKWKQNGIISAGGNEEGDQLNQLSSPNGIFIDHHNNLFIADFGNHRITEWKHDSNNVQIIAGGNDQLSRPTDIIVDKQNNSLIIADTGNRRVIRWSLQNQRIQQILISDIDCFGLSIDKNGFIYVSDIVKNDVRQWKEGDVNGIVVAGGNEKGSDHNQLNCPGFIFVDDDDSLYVSDWYNHRVMKWAKNAKEGIIVAGGKGKGSSLKQLSEPQGVIVDHLGQIYVADGGNHRVMRWCQGAKEGEIIVGKNGQGDESNQLNNPYGLSFDDEENLYVVDWGNHRIMKYEKK
ncbi:unnamed protein product [Adineta steineri]|uniref:NAD(P)(+)--arginine ADP-ribosyltransferase n=1 Tax=Adineta steineri TaxID=433720 RepID=A0A814FRU0_9BILA|nr:unnamed protein product [Adineta steineri]CAF0988058.1 unnamed protein product [Adineta steineri]